MVDVSALEERLTNQPPVSKSRSTVNGRGTVVALLLKGHSRGQNVKIDTAKGQTNSRGSVAVVVAGNDASVGVLHGLDASGLEKSLDLLDRTKDDSGARVGQDSLSRGEGLAVECDVAGDAPFILSADRRQGARELLSSHGTVVQRTGLVGLEGQAEAASRQRTLLAERVEEGARVESGAVDATVANEAVVGERWGRRGAGDVADGLLLDGQVGAMLRDDVFVDSARGLQWKLVRIHDQNAISVLLLAEQRSQRKKKRTKTHKKKQIKGTQKSCRNQKSTGE